jgi:ABC-type uncharacterized transport system ATPase subunit
MIDHSLQKCATLLTQVFGDFPTISFQNSVEINFQKLTVGFWYDRGLYSVTIADEINTYSSSAIASFLHVELHDAKESPAMLMENLEFVRDKVSEIKKLLKGNDFANRYEIESGCKPIHTETRA